MTSILFVLTTDQNMGDLALCQEWIADCGRRDHRFAFVLSERLSAFIDEADQRFYFDPETDAGRTILDAAASFGADVLIFASNSFWNMRQKGVTFGEYPFDPDVAGVPVLSFDPFEIAFGSTLPTGAHVVFPPVPESVWRLRYMSRHADVPNARHFSARRIYEDARQAPRDETLARWGIDPSKRVVLFPMSDNRQKAIQRSHPAYYAWLASLFAAERDVQFVTVSSEAAAHLASVPNVQNVPLLPFHEFLSLVAACDLYMADSFISCLVTAFHLAVPVMLLAASEASRPLAGRSFLRHQFFPWMVFPYGLADVCDALIDRFEVGGCFTRVEVLDPAAFRAGIRTALFDDDARHALAGRCRQWKDDRLMLPSPQETLQSILR